ncbi:MAG: phosphocholine cytidylyltransferase family protein [Opitutaceae bacterium]|nr:phosphocholine cytidylyltransferase family protein [Opitutaceae bacterium]
MKAIIMGAGFGSRIQGVIGDKPKCLIEVEGQTLISRMVAMLRNRGIDDISVITGFESELILDELDSGVNFFYNPFYRVTNSIASLWFARELLEGDVLLLNADLFVEDEILDIALSQTKPVVMLSDSTRIETADFRFGVEGDRILKTGNQLKNHETDCEYVGIVRIAAAFVGKFKKGLVGMVQSGDYRNWWEGVLYEFIEDGDVIRHVDIKGFFWTEVDHAADYQRLQQWISGEKVLPRFEGASSFDSDPLPNSA